MTRVLLHGPGVLGPSLPGIIAELARAGTQVDVLLAVGENAGAGAAHRSSPHLQAPVPRAPHLDDLASRGLCRLVTDADPLRYDEVRRLTVNQPVHRPGEEAPHGPAGEAKRPGRVTLVGGGPGDPGLLTVAGLGAIERADVIVCDRLAPLDALAHARADATIIHVGKIPRGAFTPQEELNRLLVEHALSGRDVVRFKGGDNFVFGRGGEEVIACRDAGLSVDVVPGVTSAIAVPALAGIPVTHRASSQGFTVVSGHVAPGDPRSDLDWAALARTRTTLVVLMGVAHLRAIASALVDGGLSASTPAATIADGAMPSERRVVATLATLPDAVADAGLGAPAITVIGDVVAALDGTRLHASSDDTGAA